MQVRQTTQQTTQQEALALGRADKATRNLFKAMRHLAAVLQRVPESRRTAACTVVTARVKKWLASGLTDAAVAVDEPFARPPGLTHGILMALRAAPGGLHWKEVLATARAENFATSSRHPDLGVSAILSQLVRKGLIDRVARGLYRFKR